MTDQTEGPERPSSRMLMISQIQRAKAGTTSAKLLEYWRVHPNASPAAVQRRYQCSDALIYAARQAANLSDVGIIKEADVRPKAKPKPKPLANGHLPTMERSTRAEALQAALTRLLEAKQMLTEAQDAWERLAPGVRLF